MEPTVWDNITAAIDFAPALLVMGGAFVGLAGAYILRKSGFLALSIFSK
nr:hypothetical protein 8 [Piscirickettsiaceae bacterium]